jgi:hypothetical protein
LDAYAHETEPPVPAVAEKELSCVTNEAETEVLAVTVTVVGELDSAEQAPAVQVQPVKR